MNKSIRLDIKPVLFRESIRSIRLLWFVSLLIASQALYGQQHRNESTSGPVNTVVFVCEHGAARSLIASAYFNQLAQERKLPVRAIFRGLNPDSTLSQRAELGLQTDGIVVPKLKPSLLTGKDIANAIQVVALDCTLPQTSLDNQKISTWQIHSSISQNYENARDEIKKKVEELLNSLSKQAFK